MTQATAQLIGMVILTVAASISLSNHRWGLGGVLLSALFLLILLIIRESMERDEA